MAIYFPPLETNRTAIVDHHQRLVAYKTRDDLLKETVLQPHNKDILVFVYKEVQKPIFDYMVKEYNLAPHLALIKSGLTNSGHTPEDLTLAIFTRFGKRYKNRVKVVNL